MRKGSGEDKRKEVSSQAKARQGFTLRILYLFAGLERETSAIAHLRKMAEKQGWQVDTWEVDIKRDPVWDLTDVDFQQKVLGHLSSGRFHIVLCTPPCSTWSRVRGANLRGPPPLRSKDYFWGFPWLAKRLARDVDLGNTLVKFSLKVWGTLRTCPKSQDGIPVFMFGERPEDLGLVVREEDKLHYVPASIWQRTFVALLRTPAMSWEQWQSTSVAGGQDGGSPQGCWRPARRCWRGARTPGQASTRPGGMWGRCRGTATAA